MPKTTKTTVTQNANGQYTTTIPKAIADALDLDDKQIEWKIASGSKLEIKIEDD